MIDLTHIREQLLEQAYLFDDPQAYEAGVDDAIDQVVHVLGEDRPVSIDLTSSRPKLRVTSS